MMKKYSFFTAIGLMAALLFTACSQDEWTDDNALPEGKYPLEIASVTMEGESSAQPWGAKGVQTRVSENEGGMGSEFQSEDAIAVSLKGETATYTYDYKEEIERCGGKVAAAIFYGKTITLPPLLIVKMEVWENYFARCFES